MKSNDAKSSFTIGFLTIIDYPEAGLFGGYLILNRLGRPLEFHCTAPVKPTRAQQILYGPTLQPYLYGEQIGRTLTTSAKTRPVAVFTDREPALTLREFVEVPVIFVPAESGPAAGGEPDAQDGVTGAMPDSAWRVDSAHPGSSRLTPFHIGRNHLAVPSWAAGDCEVVTSRLGEMADSFDFREPFGRIREAIEEARRGG